MVVASLGGAHAGGILLEAPVTIPTFPANSLLAILENPYESCGVSILWSVSECTCDYVCMDVYLGLSVAAITRDATSLEGVAILGTYNYGTGLPTEYRN